MQQQSGIAGPDERTAAGPKFRGSHVGSVVVGSLAAGFAASVVLPFLPVGTVDVHFSTAMVLFGWALGWALLAVLSIRFTDQPQRWAVVPAVFMAVAGAFVLVAPDAAVQALGWVWPPALLVLVAWVWMRAKREMHSRARVWVLNPVLAILVLFALGGIYERFSESIAPTVAMPGELFDVGPYRLHLECLGSGGPTVILEPGAGGSAASMGLIAPAAARTSRVCVYDRASRGWSDTAASPRSAAQIATDLHTLLNRAGVPGPYVLAGHSFGGQYVMTYAAKYPEEVAGIVLIDSTAASNRLVPPATAGSYSVLQHVSSLFGTTAQLGLGRPLAAANFSELPPEYRDDARATIVTPKHLAGLLAEYGVESRSASEAGALRNLGAKPLIVLTATVGNRSGWLDWQNQMVELSTNSVHRLEPGATHYSFIDDPAHAESVILAIHDVVQSVRTGSPLPSP